MVAQRICDYWVYLIPVDGLNLLPGDSVEVFLGQMTNFNFYLPGADSMTYLLIIYSMQPNDKIDRNRGNDKGEFSFNINLTIGIHDMSIRKLNIYLNPAT